MPIDADLQAGYGGYGGGSDRLGGDAGDTLEGNAWSLSGFTNLLETGGDVYSDVLRAKQKVENVVGGDTIVIPTGDATVSPSARSGGIDITMIAIGLGALFLISKVL